VRTAIVLFTRDLRVHDNPALTTAAHEADGIVPLFVFDDAILGSAFARPNRVAFLIDALRELDASLTQRGARPVLRSGDVATETIANPRPARAFNPLRQARRVDPDGAYVRRYVPELAAIEGRAAHEPWKLREHATGYSTPILDRI
jgi:deoxyribodipyrimidine photo-lyase